MNDKTLKIKTALFRAEDSIKEAYKIIGSEIKSKRLTMAKTLSAVSSDVCSVSYLCKIENNKIIPNRLYLREICKRLDMKNSKVDALMNLKESLASCIDAYFKNDLDAIKDKYIDGKSLINYRYKLIELIYHIAFNEYAQANKKVDSLIKIGGTMTEQDLVIFSLFYGILCFYNMEFDDSLASLDYVLRFCNNLCVKILAMKYKLYSYMQLNSSSAIFEYNSLINTLFINGYLDKLDEIHYLMAVFLLKDKNLIEFKRIFKLVKNARYRNSLCLLTKLILNPFMRIKPRWIENVEPFVYYLGLMKIDLKRAREEIVKLKPSTFSEHFNLLYLQYLIIETDEERLFYVNNVALPAIEKTRGSVMVNYFLNELALICKRINRYKMFVELFLKLKGIRF